MMKIFKSFVKLLKYLYDSNIRYFLFDDEILNNVYVVGEEVKMMPSFLNTLIKVNNDRNFKRDLMKESCQ